MEELKFFSKLKATNSLWTRSTFETAGLFLAVVTGIWEDRLVNTNPLLLYTIQAVLTVGTLVTMLVLRKFRKPTAHRFTKLVLKALIWVVAVLAGSLFSYGYSLAIADLLIGFPLLVAYVFLVIVIIRWIRSIQRDLELKERSMFRA